VGPVGLTGIEGSKSRRRCGPGNWEWTFADLNQKTSVKEQRADGCWPLDESYHN